MTRLLKNRAKWLLEKALVNSGLAAFGRSMRRRDTLVLAYHNVLPAFVRPSGERSLHLSESAFARQLDVLSEHCDVIPLASLFEDSQNPGRPRVVITFDDAYVGALTVAVPELARRRMAATIFAAPGLFGRATWWDILSDRNSGEVPAGVRERALELCRGNIDQVLRTFGGDASDKRFSPEELIGTEEQLRVSLQHPGIAVGSHTWSHSNLAVLSATSVGNELRESLDWLRSRFDQFVPWLSYPYGRYSTTVENAAAVSGFVGAFRVDGGWFKSDTTQRPQAIPRYNVPAGLSLDGFRLRLGGWFAGSR